MTHSQDHCVDTNEHTMSDASASAAREFAQAGEHARLGHLAELLRELRLAIPLEATYFGSFIRLKNRVGKVVSQEEFAEAIGVSRCWYGMLECGRAVRPSMALLARICDAFALDEERRLMLIALALPHLSHLILKTIATPPSEAA